MSQSAAILNQRGMVLLNQPRTFAHFTGIEAADNLLNDIDGTPHAFVLACLMDRGVKAERAWRIPYQVGVAIGDFQIASLLATGLDGLNRIFEIQGLHRFNNNMAKVFYLGVERIQYEYGGNAANIWNHCPSSARVVLRFLEFHGAGIKIATMAANILASRLSERKFFIRNWPIFDHESDS